MEWRRRLVECLSDKCEKGLLRLFRNVGIFSTTYRHPAGNGAYSQRVIGLIMQKPITGRSLSCLTVGRHRHSQALAGLTTRGKSNKLTHL